MTDRILIADDEETLRRAVRYALERDGYEVTAVSDGTEAIEATRRDRYDLAILDWMMPNTSGLEVCRQLRAAGALPIILLTARDSESDVIIGLEAGADDYLTKPFSVAELVSRVNALLRRRRLDAAEASAPTLRQAGITVDVAGRTVHVDDALVRLTPSEFDVLHLLIASPGQVFSRRAIMEHLWKATYYGDDRAADTHIANLRRKLEPDAANPARILTSRGHGYKLARDADAGS